MSTHLIRAPKTIRSKPLAEWKRICISSVVRHVFFGYNLEVNYIDVMDQMSGF
jgi:hypothetical protein